MAIYRLNLPLSKDEVKSLKMGDNIYVSGNIVTARDDAHKHALELYEKGEKLPVNFKELAIYHCGPIMEKDQQEKWKVVAAGPTTSGRMELFQDNFIEKFGTSLIIGKGGMGERTTAACRKFGAIYGMYTGGAALLAANQIKEVLEVHWFDLLGMPECLWVLKVEDFGPLLVGIDSHGNNFFTLNKEKTKQSLPNAYKIIDEVLGAN
ncbi:MAG: FumA C-terminus/TtdB family hydratase beta subunit [Candidatus Heimdallarchaeota archaeon]|nr:FumA C-terminus/TtdB family hydratase beta subunit [Candidatus Heimdallarchaeota archaeon]MDH5646830.1 FumA C-terminus/TtdB family hydratase beta subunit [Candidatus Heimdallarchaeota archaeon]